jgi:hypothetical protein
MPGERRERATLRAMNLRRPADRHYLGVVAEEARRLARQLRPPTPPRSGNGPLGRQPHPRGAH